MYVKHSSTRKCPERDLYRGVGLKSKDRQRPAKTAKTAKTKNKDGKDQFNLAKIGKDSKDQVKNQLI